MNGSKAHHLVVTQGINVELANVDLVYQAVIRFEAEKVTWVLSRVLIFCEPSGEVRDGDRMVGE